MPCYLFTYHTYGSWYPDRPKGYVRRSQGIVPSDPEMAKLYRDRDATHIHVLVSWRSERTWQQNRASLKKSMTILLKEKFSDRPWLTENASRKRVEDTRHFDHLMNVYLPKHKGWKWREGKGLYL